MTTQQTAKLAIQLTKENGGATILRNGLEASQGFAVGGVMEFSYYEPELSPEYIKGYILDAVDCIKNGTACDAFGFWMDGKTLYIDAVNIFDDEAEALAFARKNNELAIYNITKQQEVRC